MGEQGPKGLFPRESFLLGAEGSSLAPSSVLLSSSFLTACQPLPSRDQERT